MVDFIFVIIELLRYLLRLRRYERKSVEVSIFRRGWHRRSQDFQRVGAPRFESRISGWGTMEGFSVGLYPVECFGRASSVSSACATDADHVVIQYTVHVNVV